MSDRLLKVADSVKEDVCNILCWGGHPIPGARPPKHHPRCAELRAAISEAIDDNSYADLRASGGIVGAP